LLQVKGRADERNSKRKEERRKEESFLTFPVKVLVISSFPCCENLPLPALIGANCALIRLMLIMIVSHHIMGMM